MKQKEKKLFILIILLTSLFISCKKELKYKRPDFNVILIVIDTVRADHLPFYGYKLNTAPNLSIFSTEGILFKHFYSNTPSTKPSISSLFTSAYPSQHKCIQNEDILNSKLITIAEILKKNNYYSVGVSDNYLISDKFNFNQGFNIWKNINRNERSEFDGANRVNKIIFEEIEKIEKKPFFLYLHYLDPHEPYRVPLPFYKHFNTNYIGKVTGDLHLGYSEKSGDHPSLNYFKTNSSELEQLKLFYDNCIYYCDNQIGILFDKLKEKNIYDNSIIVISADHGEMFLEHGYFEHSNGLYSELINVPLIIRIPGLNNIILDEYIQTIDIFPTILDILNIKKDSTFMGDSIFKIVNKQNRPILSEHLRLNFINPQISLILNNFKIIENLQEQNVIDKKNKYELFDIISDNFEINNIFYKTSNTDKLLKQFYLFRREKNKYFKNIDIETTDIDQITYRHLKSLGYIK